MDAVNVWFNCPRPANCAGDWIALLRGMKIFSRLRGSRSKGIIERQAVVAALQRGRSPRSDCEAAPAV